MSGKDKYTNSAPPLGFDQAWIDDQLKNGSGVDLLTAQILSQKTYDKWTGQGFGSVKANAASMARRLSDAGVKRLEDFGQRKVPEMQTLGFTAMPVYVESGWDGGSSLAGYAWKYPVPDTEGGTTWANATPEMVKNLPKPGPGSGTGDGDYTLMTASATIPTGQTKVEYYNKATGAKVGGDAQSGDTFDKTFAGDGSTTFNVQFNNMGMPMFYSQYGGSSSDWGTVSSILSVASFIPGVGPFAAALNAVGNAYNGNTVGAVLSALSAAGSFGSQYGTIDPSSANAVNGMDAASDAAAGATSGMTSVANWFAQNAGVIQTAQQGVAALNALDKGNIAGVISGLMNIAPQVGVTIPSEVIKPISAAATASAISKGDWAGAMAAASTLTDNPTLRQDAKLATKAMGIINAVKSGNPASIMGAAMGFAKQSDLGSSTAKSLAASFGIEMSDKDLVAFDNAAPDSEAFDAATHGLVKMYETTVADAKSEYKDITGKEMPDSVLESLMKTGDIAGSMDKLETGLEGTDEETKAKAFEELNGGVDKALEFVADQKETTVDEARAIMKDLGYTDPTDEEVQQFAGQLDESSAKTSAGEYVGQHTVTEDEARKYLTDLGYNPTDDEVKEFAKQGADIMQGDVESQLGEYASARTIDRAEAENFFKELGYTPSEEELQQFMRQGADVTADAVAAELGQYVDENQITADEARDIYAQLGLDEVTQRDIDKLLGQYSEADLEARAEENLDTARYNTLTEKITDLAENGDSGEVDQEAITDAVNAATDDLRTAIDDVQAGNDERFSDIDDAIQSLRDAGLAEEDVQAIVDANSENLSAEFKDQLDTAVSGLATQEGVEAAVEGVQSNVDQLAEDLGMTKDELLAQMNSTEEELSKQLEQFDTQFSEELAQQGEDLTGQIEDVKTSTQEGLDALEGRFKTMYDESSQDTQAKYDELTDQQKTLAASLAASTGDLQAAIDEAAQNTSDMFANLEETFGGQLEDFQTTFDTRVKELQDQGMSQADAIKAVNGELDQMRSDFGVQLGGTEQKLGQKIDQQTINFGNWQKEQAAKAAADQAAAAKAAADRDAAVQKQIASQASSQNALNALMMSGFGKYPAATVQQQEATKPWEEFMDIGSEFSPTAFGRMASQGVGQATKIATGGYIDDLLAGNITADDLLKLLRN